MVAQSRMQRISHEILKYLHRVAAVAAHYTAPHIPTRRIREEEAAEIFLFYDRECVKNESEYVCVVGRIWDELKTKFINLWVALFMRCSRKSKFNATRMLGDSCESVNVRRAIRTIIVRARIRHTQTVATLLIDFDFIVAPSNTSRPYSLRPSEPRILSPRITWLSAFS